MRCVSDFEANGWGTPFLKSMLRWLEDHAPSPLFGYMNGDILFQKRLIPSLEAVLAAVNERRVNPRLLLIGRRTNFRMPFPLREDSRWMLNNPATVDRTIREMAVRGRIFQFDAEDYFILRRGTFDWSKILDFVIGRVAYDNWLVDHAYHEGVDRVELTNTVHVVHQTGVDGNHAGHSKERPDKPWNTDLVSESGAGGYDHGQTNHCNWQTRFQSTDGQTRIQLIPISDWHSPNRPSDLRID